MQEGDHRAMRRESDRLVNATLAAMGLAAALAALAVHLLGADWGLTPELARLLAGLMLATAVGNLVVLQLWGHVYRPER